MLINDLLTAYIKATKDRGSASSADCSSFRLCAHTEVHGMGLKNTGTDVCFIILLFNSTVDGCDEEKNKNMPLDIGFNNKARSDGEKLGEI